MAADWFFYDWFFFWSWWLIFFMIDFFLWLIFYDWFFKSIIKKSITKRKYDKINQESFKIPMWLIFFDYFSITSIYDWFFLTLWKNPVSQWARRWCEELSQKYDWDQDVHDTSWDNLRASWWWTCVQHVRKNLFLTKFWCARMSKWGRKSLCTNGRLINPPG